MTYIPKKMTFEDWLDLPKKAKEYKEFVKQWAKAC